MSLLENDLKCKAVAAMVYEKIYTGHKPNEWEPWNEPKTTVFADGLVCKNDLRYSDRFPNSFLDIWYPDNSQTVRPAVVYFHGGGFIFGDKTTGDPLSVGGKGDKLKEIVRAGYILVNANYALAPEYRFPTQLIQADEVFRYLLKNADALHIDAKHFALSGGSAGADMTEIYGACVTNPDYAKMLGVDPVMTPDQLKVLLIDEAAVDCRGFNDGMFAMLGCWMGAESNAYEGLLQLMNVPEYISSYIPAWINASGEGEKGSDFYRSAVGLKEKLEKLGVPHDMVYFWDADLPHGYMERLDEPHGRMAFDRMMAFLTKHI